MYLDQAINQWDIQELDFWKVNIGSYCMSKPVFVIQPIPCKTLRGCSS